MNMREKIELYKPFNEQEERDKELILEYMAENPNIFLRESRLAHMTASAWIVNKERTKVLMVYHNIYNSWSWLGGHADGETDLLKVALQEAREESGLRNVRPVSEDIYSLESLTVDGHMKKENYVSSHLHLNVTYLLEADEEEALSIKPDENSGVAWFGLEEAIEASTEEWFKENVYSKLNDKLRKY
nr:NUDIX hydrolase [uncultured Lachnoclostridium sp.]